MVAPRTVSFGMMMTGGFALLRGKALPVAVACVSFAMVTVLASAFVLRHVDRIQEDLAQRLSISRDDLEKEIETQLLALGSLGMREFMELAQGAGGMTFVAELKPDPSRLGIAYILRAGPYLFLEFVIDLFTFYVAAVFFFVLFTRGTIAGYDAVRLLPISVFKSFGLLLWCLFRPFFSLTIFGPVLAMTVLLSGEAGIRESVRIGSKRMFSKPLAIMVCGVGAVIVACLFMWPMLVLSAIVSLYSMKLAAYLLFCVLFLTIAFLCALYTMLAAIVA